jgi:hypothetical protein
MILNLLGSKYITSHLHHRHWLSCNGNLKIVKFLVYFRSVSAHSNVNSEQHFEFPCPFHLRFCHL